MMSTQRARALALACAPALLLLLASCGDDRTPPAALCASSFDRSCPDATGTSVCVPISTDPNNCGGCGNRCATGEACRASACIPVAPRPDGGGGFDLGPPGACMPSCPSTQRCCGTSCVNRQVASGTDGRSDRSFMNCGGCGLACDPVTASACSGTACTCGTRGTPCADGQICVNGGGGFTCQANCGTTGGPCPGGATCCGVGDAAMCLNTQVDTLNCGMCGRACDVGLACSAGNCVALCGGSVCAAGQLCCGDACVRSDAANCGGCGVTCSGLDVCGTVFGTATVCCGEDLGFGILLSCTPPGVDAGAPDAGDVDAGDVDAGDVDLGSG